MKNGSGDLEIDATFSVFANQGENGQSTQKYHLHNMASPRTCGFRWLSHQQNSTTFPSRIPAFGSSNVRKQHPHSTFWTSNVRSVVFDFDKAEALRTFLMEKFGDEHGQDLFSKKLQTCRKHWNVKRRAKFGNKELFKAIGDDWEE